MYLTANLRSRRLQNGHRPHDGHVDLTVSVTHEVHAEALPTYNDRAKFCEVALRMAGFARFMTPEFRWSVSVDVETDLAEQGKF